MNNPSQRQTNVSIINSIQLTINHHHPSLLTTPHYIPTYQPTMPTHCYLNYIPKTYYWFYCSYGTHTHTHNIHNIQSDSTYNNRIEQISIKLYDKQLLSAWWIFPYGLRIKFFQHIYTTLKLLLDLFVSMHVVKRILCMYVCMTSSS